jgi:hypothetical protein
MAKKARASSRQVNINCRAGYCYVEPPVETVSKSARDQIRWRGTNTGATIYFPTTCPFGWQMQTVPNGGAVDSGPVTPGCAEGTYQYVVYCSDCRSPGQVRFAIGHSNPQVKVDP